jgi:hypothetical protein
MAPIGPVMVSAKDPSASDFARRDMKRGDLMLMLGIGEGQGIRKRLPGGTLLETVYFRRCPSSAKAGHSSDCIHCLELRKVDRALAWQWTIVLKSSTLETFLNSVCRPSTIDAINSEPRYFHRSL